MRGPAGQLGKGEGGPRDAGARDWPVGGPERRAKSSKSRPRRVLRIKTGPLTMGKISCTDHLHTSPIVRIRILIAFWARNDCTGGIPPTMVGEYMKGTPGPLGLAGKCAAAAGAVRVGSVAAGVTRRACRYGSGQGPVPAVTRVLPPVPGAPPAPPPRGRAGSPAGLWPCAGRPALLGRRGRRGHRGPAGERAGG